MKKIMLFLFLLLVPFSVRAMEVELYSNNAIVYDIESQKILFSKGDINEKVSIASITKIMTSIVAIENIENLDEEVEITAGSLQGVPWDASVAGLKIGDRVTYRDLLYCALLPSGADATNSLAYHISGSIPKFVELMNDKAKELGLENTNFMNTTGYDKDNHYSSIYDVLKIILYALKNESFREIYTTREYTLLNGLQVVSTLSLYNKAYNYDISNILGSKTGFTSKAGTCISALTNIYDREIIIITLGAPREEKKAYNLEDLMTLIDGVKNNYENRTIYKKGDTILTLPVEDSKVEEYDIKSNIDIIKFLEKNDNSGNVRFDYEGLDKLSYKTKPGKIGSVTYYYENEILGSYDVILDERLEVDFIKAYGLWIILGVVLVVLVILLKLNSIVSRR